MLKTTLELPNKGYFEGFLNGDEHLLRYPLLPKQSFFTIKFI